MLVIIQCVTSSTWSSVLREYPESIKEPCGIDYVCSSLRDYTSETSSLPEIFPDNYHLKYFPLGREKYCQMFEHWHEEWNFEQMQFPK